MRLDKQNEDFFMKDKINSFEDISKRISSLAMPELTQVVVPEEYMAFLHMMTWCKGVPTISSALQVLIELEA